jgi:DUF1680 family protein
LRWSKIREEYITLCNCCPPNTLRTICEAQNYAYTMSDDALWCNLYGESELTTTYAGKPFVVKHKTGYPYDGKILLEVAEIAKKSAMKLYLRIPEWCDNATVKVNGKPINLATKANTYACVERQWKKGDKVELDLEMRVKLLESNPLVEESRNETVVKRGPLVYCLESCDIEGGKKIDNVLIPSDIKFEAVPYEVAGSKMVALEGTARLMEEKSWENTLYREVGKADGEVKIRLIPYFAWGNRDHAEMTVWMPLAR